MVQLHPCLQEERWRSPVDRTALLRRRRTTCVRGFKSHPFRQHVGVPERTKGAACKAAIHGFKSRRRLQGSVAQIWKSACLKSRRPAVRFLLEPHQHVSMARAAKALGCKPSEAKASSPVQVLVLPHSLISGRGEAGRRAGLRTRWGGSPV